jgi:glycosyltransferase involved in cell wall biosynthesis
LKIQPQKQAAEPVIGIVAMVPEVWSEVKMSRHHLLEGLSKDYKVLWVAPPVYLQDLVQSGFRTVQNGRELIKRSDRFWVFGMILPAGYRMNWKKKGLAGALVKAYEKIWQKAFVWKLKGILKSMGLDECILYIWRPEYGWMIGRLGESCLVYHMVDEYSFDPEKDHPIQPDEQKLIEDSDLVVIHSQSLFEKKGHINANTHILPNGVDFERYRAAVEQMDSEPPELTLLSRPKIGYMGFIKRHLDLRLVIELATARPKWSFIMVGPVRENHAEIREAVQCLRNMPNVHFTGSVDAAELPRYVKSFDVAIMPYKNTFYTKYIYPLKLHEYLSVGLPVVSTPLRNLIEFKDLVSFAESRDQWIATIEQCIRENDAAKAADRVAVASRNSWRGRVAALSIMIREAREKAKDKRNVP